MFKFYFCSRSTLITSSFSSFASTSFILSSISTKLWCSKGENGSEFKCKKKNKWWTNTRRAKENEKKGWTKERKKLFYGKVDDISLKQSAEFLRCIVAIISLPSSLLFLPLLHKAPALHTLMITWKIHSLIQNSKHIFHFLYRVDASSSPPLCWFLLYASICYILHAHAYVWVKLKWFSSFCSQAKLKRMKMMVFVRAALALHFG